MKTRYGLEELMRRVSRGSIQARTAEDDDDEWEFRCVKRSSFCKDTVRQSREAKKEQKMEPEDWERLCSKADPQARSKIPKLTDLLSNSNCDNSEAKKLKKLKKDLPALKDKESSEAEASDAEESQADEDAQKAEQLSSMSIKTNGASRLKKMITLLENLVQEHGTKNTTILKEPLKKLSDLQKKKFTMEQAKTALLAAAQAVKACKKKVVK
jgi:hypothetical protein